VNNRRRDRRAAEQWQILETAIPGVSQLIQARSMDAQIDLPLPSSVKKKTASEAAALVTTKGLHIADQPRRA
jgi:hypothetical protein